MPPLDEIMFIKGVLNGFENLTFVMLYQIR
jgi:hypothetical protein